MKVCALALLATSILLASDPRQLALALKAQAAALAVSLPEERSLLFYRKGYCNFAGAAASEDPRQFLTTAAEFDKAVEVWPDRLRKNPKHAPPEPVPAALHPHAPAGVGSPHALYLRARAKELAGSKDAALADYNLASRTAFAAARDLASGEAHLYRGIVLFRRQDFARAEEEFSSALNFEMTGALLPDARAWRRLAAVAGGSCGESRQSLNLALAAVSPFFPRDEARSLASACGPASIQ